MILCLKSSIRCRRCARYAYECLLHEQQESGWYRGKKDSSLIHLWIGDFFVPVKNSIFRNKQTAQVYLRQTAYFQRYWALSPMKNFLQGNSECCSLQEAFDINSIIRGQKQKDFRKGYQV